VPTLLRLRARLTHLCAPGYVYKHLSLPD
jgi:hypothetical protein